MAAVLNSQVSLIPQVTAYVIAAWQASGGDLAGVSIIEGPIALEELTQDTVVIADAKTDQELAHFGAAGLKREETAHITIAVWVVREGSPQTELSERAWAIASRLAAVIAADYTLGGLCHLATVAPNVMEKFFSGSAGGRMTTIRSELEIIGRVS